MATCPNKNSEDWKKLVADKGERTAYYLWYTNNGDISKFVNYGRARTLPNDIDVYRKFNLINKNGEIKYFKYETPKQIKETNAIVDSFNRSPYYTFKVGKTPTGYKIFIFDKVLSAVTPSRGTTDPLIEQKYFPTRTEKASTILNKIGESDHPLAPLAKQLSKYIDANDVNIQLVDEPLVTKVGPSSGVYYPSSNDIKIYKDAKFKGKGSEPTLIHEIIHGLTYYHLKNNTAAREEFQRIYDKAKETLPAYDPETKEGVYAMSNLDEFMTGIFTDAKFIAQLKNIPAIESKFKNLWEELLSFINSLFDIKKESSLYDQAFSVATNIFEEVKQAKEEYESTPTDTLSRSDLIALSKDLYKRMGVSLKDIDDMVSDGVTLSPSELADIGIDLLKMIKGQDTSYADESIELALNIVQQKNPKLFTQFLSKINSYSDLKNNFSKYAEQYTDADGKPDVLQIKKRVILDVLQTAHNAPDYVNNPNESQEMLTSTMSYVRSLVEQSNFDAAAIGVLIGDYNGPVDQYREMLASPEESPDQIKNAVDAAYDKFKDINRRVERIEETATDKRHYTFDGVRATVSVTEKLSKKLDRTPEEQRVDTIKALWGSEAHDYIDQSVKEKYTDENGYIRDEFVEKSISTKLSPAIQAALDQYLIDLMNEYKAADALRTDGAKTRIVTETRVINNKVKGMMASTIDFIALVPDDDTGVKIDTLDWKLVDINTKKDVDIPWYKRKSWNDQMSEYVKMYTIPLFGFKKNQIGQARMVPIQAKYKQTKIDGKYSDPYLTAISVGSASPQKADSMYVTPVPIRSETTNNALIDDLLKSLYTQYDKMFTSALRPGQEKYEKDEELNRFMLAIRALHVKLDFEPISVAAQNYINAVSEVLNDLEGIDYSTLTMDQINAKLSLILAFEASANKFTKLDDIFLSKFDNAPLSDDALEELAEIRKVVFDTKSLLNKLKGIQRGYAVHMAVKTNVVKEEYKEDALEAERAIDSMSKSFLEGSKLSSTLIKTLQNLVLTAKSLVNIRLNQEFDKYSDILNKAEIEAKAIGKDVFDVIGRKTATTLKFVTELSSDFWTQFEAAKKDEDIKFLLNNIDAAKYDKLSQAFIDKRTAEIESKTYVPNNPVEDQLAKSRAIAKVKRSVSLGSSDFDGYYDYNFKRIYLEALNREKWYSDEYKELSKHSNLLELWKYFNKLNEKAKTLGYLSKDDSLSFFPLIEESFARKVYQSGKIVKESMDFFKEFYSVQPEEEVKFNKLDPETNELMRLIPKYFTHNGKELSKLSTDMNKVGLLWIKSIYEYESLKELENTALVLHKVEESKGTTVVDENGNLVLDDRGVAKVDQNNKTNADIMSTMIDDYFYGRRENESSLGNIAVAKLAGRVSADEEVQQTVKVNVKKGLDTVNTYIRALAVGLKASIAVPNFFGNHFQAYVNAGRHYNYSEFLKNNMLATSGYGMSTIKKGLIDLFVPLSEDLTKERIRHNAKEKSYAKFLETWNFTDIMMISNAWPERKIQIANAGSFVDNTGVVNGKLVNLREYLAKKDRAVKYNMTFEERVALEKSFEPRLKDLISTNALENIAKIEDDKIVIPGITDEDLAAYRTTIIEFGRNLNGQMSQDNKAGYTRDSIFKSFMMFRTWMPKQISLRAMDIHVNPEIGAWEYGRTRLFVKTISHLGLKNTLKMKHILNGTPEGLQIMQEMYENKKDAYFKRHGKELRIDSEEFYDMVRQELSNQIKEIKLLLGLLAIVTASGFAVSAADDDDDDLLNKNRLKFLAKLINKTSDEVWFYYSPTSFQSMTNGSLLPALGLMTKVDAVFTNASRYVYGEYTGNDELIKKAHTTKAVLDMIPILSQFQREALPYIDAELAKELGIRVSAEARQGR